MNMQEAQYLSSLIGILAAVFLFGFAIFVHELGHFVVAKLSGVGVNKFAIGFGPVIWRFVKGETEYSIRWIPLGGFVALKGMIEGMDEEEDDDQPGKPKPETEAKKPSSMTEDLDALRSKPAWVRIAVFASGVTCNYLTAIVLMAFLLWHGQPEPEPLPNRLQEIPADTVWYDLGYRSGDEIVGVNRESVSLVGQILTPESESGSTNVLTEPIESWKDLIEQIYLATRRSDTGTSPTLFVQVDRNGQLLTLPLPIGYFLNEDKAEYFQPPLPAYVGGVYPASPAHRARLVERNYHLGEKATFPPWD
ncbi:site-2 protease family protein, partial [bacterium]|nr:site-2 protease family protein [bacterium]